MDEGIDYELLVEMLENEVPAHHMEAVLQMAEAMIAGDDSATRNYKSIPVTFEVFITSPDFMNKPKVLFDTVMKEAIELNTGDYVEAVMTGGIGSGKTTLALYTTAYQLYLLSCYEDPHAEFGLDPASEIQFIFQSINAGLAKQVSYKRFRAMIETSPYFKKHFKFDKKIESKLVFPNRIEVIPISGMESASIGQNVIGGIIDEINYMAVIENSANNRDGGTYNQAITLYNSIARRRRSRFMRKGKMPGILCLVSSRRYPGQFTDRKEEERERQIEKHGKSTIFLYDKCSWDIKPDDYGDAVFYVFIGDDSRKPRILEDDERVAPADRNLVRAIPLEHLDEFETDLLNSLREVAGVSTLARSPYILELEKIVQCFGKTTSILSAEEVDFDRKKLRVHTSRMMSKQFKRFAHVDLGVTGDGAGVAMGHIPGFEVVDFEGSRIVMPVIQYDFLLRVMPPKNGEIQFWKIRKLFEVIRNHGIPLTWISYDSFQSVDSLQILRQYGFITGNVSMDKNSLAYDILKTAIYDGRIYAPVHAVAKKELSALERDSKTGKIDHPPEGSKDVADAMAGVAYGLTMRKQLWVEAGIPTGRIPESLFKKMADAKKQDEKSDRIKRAA